MTRMGRREYLRAIHDRYRRAAPKAKGPILDEFCRVCGYNRKYAIRLLGRPCPSTRPGPRRPRRPHYGPDVIRALMIVWKAAGYPWSVRLKVMLPMWLPWLRKRLPLSRATERQLLKISSRQIDRRLQSKKSELRHRMYGRTKPGTLLKHQVPIKTDRWDVSIPGFTEIDLVSHSSEAAEAEAVFSLNVTDIHTTWTVTRAVLGKGQEGVVSALEEMRMSLPFQLRGIDSDNGSEFLNFHLVRYTQSHGIQFTRGRPYKKDDNAHIEQKNWTHVRKVFGWDCYEGASVAKLMNDLYHNELSMMMNLFQPSVKLIRRERVGSRIRRIYDKPATPLDRLRRCPGASKPIIEHLLRVRATTDPFELAKTIENKLDRIAALGSRNRSGRVTSQTA